MAHELSKLYRYSFRFAFLPSPPLRGLKLLAVCSGRSLQESLGCLTTVVSRVVIDVIWNHGTGAHEWHQGNLVVQILGDCGYWPGSEEVKLLNVYDLPLLPRRLIKLTQRFHFRHIRTINPVEFRSTNPDGAPLTLEGNSEIASGTTASQEVRFLNRILDWCLGLQLGYDDAKILRSAFGTVRLNEASLNQTVSCIRQRPLFMDAGIKKTQTNRSPAVQLVIWARPMRCERNNTADSMIAIVTGDLSNSNAIFVSTCLYLESLSYEATEFHALYC